MAQYIATIKVGLKRQRTFSSFVYSDRFIYH